MIPKSTRPIFATLIVTLAFALLMCGVTSCKEDNQAESAPQVSAVGQVLQNPHILHQLKVGSEGHYLVTLPNDMVRFAWSDNEKTIRISDIPITKIRFQVNEVPLPVVRFRWKTVPFTNPSDTQSIINDNVIYALVICTQADLPQGFNPTNVAPALEAN